MRGPGTTNTFDAKKSGFSKVARGNQKDDGLSNLNNQEISDTLKGLNGQLTKEQKARRIRNVQKKDSEKGTGTGRR